MENEKPPQRERRPLDVFDPTEDGYEPYTLEQVLETGQELLEAFDKFQAALWGCMTPLSLNREERITRQLREQMAEALVPISKAKDIIESDLPLAAMSSDEIPFGEGWAFPKPSRGTLSPERILEVRLRSRQVVPEEQTTYRCELEKLPKVPSLIRRQRVNAELEARRARFAAMTDEEKAAAQARRAATRAANRGRIPTEGPGSESE